MAGVGVLRSGPQSLRALTATLLRSKSPINALTTKTMVRQMGSHRTMQLQPTRYEWTKFKDDMHFYLALGLIPIGALVTYVNIFIGKAELADIPEGYEPKEEEYYSHPIKRWIVKNLYPPISKEYEKYLHLVNSENEKKKLRALEKRVKELMAERGDHKGWYYLPMNERQVYSARTNYEETAKDQGVAT